MSTTIIPSDTILYRSFQTAINARRMVFFAGLPGVGKSLLLKQLALMAQGAGRSVHLLQWDVTRAAFETPEILERYPEVDGVTHAAIRKAVGLWARKAVLDWHKSASNQDILIGEVPLIGNRLIELTQVFDDETEALLASDDVLFMLPVPSSEVRRHIEQARDASMKQPKHERESADAPMNVLQALWQDLHRLGVELGLARASDSRSASYNPDVYEAVYRHLLEHRKCKVLQIDEVFQAQESVYHFEFAPNELSAKGTDVVKFFK